MRFPKLSALALAATLASPAFASAVFDGYVITNLGTGTGTGTGDVFYETDLATANNPDWTGLFATIQQGSSLWLGGQVKSWPGLTKPVGIPDKPNANASFDTMVMNYSIDGHTALSLNLLRTDFANINDDLWQNSGSGVDVARGLDIGFHTIKVSFAASDTDGGTGNSALDKGGLGWTATVSVVPEPTSGALILAGLGMLGFITKRRRAVG